MTTIETLPKVDSTETKELITDNGHRIAMVTEFGEDPAKKHIGCLVVGGFMSTETTNSGFRSAFVIESGIDTATMGYSEVGLPDILETDKIRIEDVEAAIRQMAELKQEIIIVTHSMGEAIAIDTVLQLELELFRKIKAVVMVNGAGLITGEGIFKILPRVYRAYEEGKKNGKGFGETIKGRQKTRRQMAARLIRLVADGFNAARNKSLSEIRQLNARGIKIINVVSQYDEVFPEDLVNDSVADLPLYAQASMIGGTHFTPSEQPKALAKAVKGLIAGLW